MLDLEIQGSKLRYWHLRPNASKLKRWCIKLGGAVGLRWHAWRNKHVRTVPIFVICVPRSGSTLLHSLFNVHDHIQCYSEVFEPKYALHPTVLPNKQAVFTYLQRIVDSANTPYVSCKVFLRDLLKHSVSVSDLKNVFPGAKFIVLYRENALEQFFSYKFADATLAWIAEQETTAHREQQITIDIDEFYTYRDNKVRQYKQVLQDLEAMTESVLITYQNLISDYETVLKQKVWPYLGLQFQPIPTKYLSKKQFKKPLEKHVQNFSEVQLKITEKDYMITL